MSLREYQQKIDVAKLYLSRKNPAGSEQLRPTIEVIGGTVNVYGSQVKPTNAPVGMFLTEPTFVGIIPFDNIPNYLYIEQASGTSTSVVISGVTATEVI